MKKPYYKSKLRLQKRKSTKDLDTYLYEYDTIKIRVEVIKTKNKYIIVLWDNIHMYNDILDYFGIFKLNINRIIKQYPNQVLLAIKTCPGLNICHQALLQCGFVLQYTKENGYHFIR